MPMSDLQLVEIAAKRRAKQNYSAAESYKGNSAGWTAHKKIADAFHGFAQELRTLRKNREVGVEPTWEEED